ncbi:MAG: hypothetical protein KF889_08030 [Alphaproteobacteria bacterium]|nr:hypothetical protein [Alphaproteobacteria bacterium]MCW5740766.1 hypothetical protein [Alphaproteobacteria bacterium]
MSDDAGPWSLWDFARRHAGAPIGRKAAGYLWRFDVAAVTLDEVAQRHVAYGVRREHPGAHVYGSLEPRFREACELFAERLRLLAYLRLTVGLPRLVKRVLMAGHHVVTAEGIGRRRTLSPEDIATLDIDFAQDALVGPRLRFDGVTVAARAGGARVGAGRPAEYDWEAFARWAGATAYNEGFPERKADFVRKAQAWFMKQYGNEPAQSTIRERIDALYAAHGIDRKSRKT